MFRNLLLIVAVFGLGWGASFGAGIAFGRRSMPAAPIAQAAAIPGAGQALTGGGAAGGQGAGAAGQGAVTRGAAVGTVQSVDGQTLTLTGPNNQQVKVTLTGQTQILKLGDATPADITTGATVTVQPQGQPASDGTVTAQSVTIVPAGAAARLQVGPGGAGGQGQGGPGGQQRPGGQGGQAGQGQQPRQGG